LEFLSLKELEVDTKKNKIKKNDSENYFPILVKDEYDLMVR
jgi:hypothetical protein